jgi:hypothetical protein
MTGDSTRGSGTLVPEEWLSRGALCNSHPGECQCLGQEPLGRNATGVAARRA